MSDRGEELKNLTEEFVDAFNRQDIEAVVGFFASEGQYEDITGKTFVGPDEIRAAFEPLVGGARGQIQFDGEDYFAEPESGKVMVSWGLTMEIEGRPMKMRGLDILHFRGDKLIRKQAYCKTSAPQLDQA